MGGHGGAGGRQARGAPGPTARAPDARPDEELWSRIASHRDAQAFSELCGRYDAQVWRLAHRLTGCAELADDVTQDVLLRLWEEPHRFDVRRGLLRHYLLRDCHGRAIDRVRAEERRRRRVAGWAARQSDVSASAEEVVLRSLGDDRLRELIRGLPDAQRVALTLAFVEGHSYRLVALTLDVPEGTVKARIRAALRNLRTGLTGGADPGT